MAKHYEKAQMSAHDLELAELISASPGTEEETPERSEGGNSDEEGEMSNGRRFFRENW